MPALVHVLWLGSDGWQSRVMGGILGHAEWKGWGPHSHTLCFIPPSLQPNRIICCFSVSLKTLCLWMWYSPCFNPDSFSSQFLLVYYAWIDFTSSRKASCMPLLDDVLVVILPQTLGFPLSWHLPCSSVIIGFLVCLSPVPSLPLCIHSVNQMQPTCMWNWIDSMIEFQQSRTQQ